MASTPQFLVYALVDPRSGQWRYIGKSSSGLDRPKQHRTPSELRKDPNAHKVRWIQKLQRLGLSYSIEVLEHFPAEDCLNSAEMEWIAAARLVGVPLVNKTDGGDGLFGQPCPEEKRKRISISNMEAKRKLTVEQERALCDEYLAGATTYELASRFALERHTVGRWLRRNGIPIRKKTEASRRKISTRQIDEVVQLYRDGWSTKGLAKRFNTYGSNIWNSLRGRTDLRTRSEATLNALQRQAARAA